ncbi:MAG: CopG family ribbon-helix-helix protein [Candidatus Binataceae bacterium]
MARNRATTTGIKLDSRTRTRLKTLSRLKQRSQHWLMKEAIARYLEQEEGAERLKRETLERWERYEATGEHIRGDAINTWLESWGTEEEAQCPSSGA